MPTFLPINECQNWRRRGIPAPKNGKGLDVVVSSVFTINWTLGAGIGKVESGTNTIHFIHPRNKPTGQKSMYLFIILAFCPQKDDPIVSNLPWVVIGSTTPVPYPLKLLKFTPPSCA